LIDFKMSFRILSCKLTTQHLSFRAQAVAGSGLSRWLARRNTRF